MNLLHKNAEERNIPIKSVLRRVSEARLALQREPGYQLL